MKKNESLANRVDCISSEQQLEELKPEHFFMIDKAILLHPKLGLDAALLFDEIRQTMTYNKTGVVFRTRDKIEEKITLKRKRQQGARKKLVDAELIKEKKMGNPCRVYYYINGECLKNLARLREQTPTEKVRQVPTEKVHQVPTEKVHQVPTEKVRQVPTEKVRQVPTIINKNTKENTKKKNTEKKIDSRRESQLSLFDSPPPQEESSSTMEGKNYPGGDSEKFFSSRVEAQGGQSKNQGALVEKTQGEKTQGKKLKTQGKKSLEGKKIAAALKKLADFGKSATSVEKLEEVSEELEVVRKKSEAGGKLTKDEQGGLFEIFWEVYGLKKRKPGSRKLFLKLSVADQIRAILRIPLYDGYLETRRTEGFNQAKQHPITYLREKTFEDEFQISEETTSDLGGQKTGRAGEGLPSIRKCIQVFYTKYKSYWDDSYKAYFRSTRTLFELWKIIQKEHPEKAKAIVSSLLGDAS